MRHRRHSCPGGSRRGEYLRGEEGGGGVQWLVQVCMPFHNQVRGLYLVMTKTIGSGRSVARFALR